VQLDAGDHPQALRPALSLAVVARDYIDAVLVPDHPGPHAELADRVLEVLDQLGGIESVF
jgi:hypothetical protein